MTFFAAKSTETGYAGQPRVDVHVTYGPVSIKVTEDPGHLRSFHRELGRLLDGIEQATAPAPQAETSVPLTTATASGQAHLVQTFQSADRGE